MSSHGFYFHVKHKHFVPVQTEQAGLIFIEPNKQFFRNNLCIVCTGLHQVQHNTDFKNLIANMEQHPKTLNFGQTVAVAVEHSTLLMDAPTTYAEVLGIIVEKLNRKRPCGANAEDVINLSLATNLERAFGEKE